ncbi:MAG: hypothetical protein JNK67_08555 [Alphaproteobacteria bacterium]|nr:hypothetical protein [Alphaproteobacteria bacterium]
MDRAGIEHSLLVAARCSDRKVRGSTEIPDGMVRDLCAKHLDRFSRRAGIDPTRGITRPRKLDVAVRKCAFVGVHRYSPGYEMAPDAAVFCPYDARYAGLGILIVLAVGPCRLSSKNRCRPITRDRVALRHPERQLVCFRSTGHRAKPSRRYFQTCSAMRWKLPPMMPRTSSSP